MRDWLAFKPVVMIAALFGLALLLIYGALSLGWYKHLIPSPEGTAEQLVSALEAHRYEGAMNQLSQDLQQQVKEEGLISLMKDLEESSLKGIQDAHGQQSREEGDQATATVKVKFGNNQEQDINFPLKKENGLWKVSSLDPLLDLR